MSDSSLRAYAAPHPNAENWWGIGVPFDDKPMFGYANFWWGISRSALYAMLATARFEVVGEREYDRFSDRRGSASGTQGPDPAAGRVLSRARGAAAKGRAARTLRGILRAPAQCLNGGAPGRDDHPTESYAQCRDHLYGGDADALLDAGAAGRDVIALVRALGRRSCRVRSSRARAGTTPRSRRAPGRGPTGAPSRAPPASSSSRGAGGRSHPSGCRSPAPPAPPRLPRRRSAAA